VILALAGGVGGAKLAHGLTRIVAPDELVIAVNTGDDFEHLGLHVSPDLDSVMYKLAGLNDAERGWGMAHESWHFMAALARLGGESWFRLGDRDLATHVERTRRLSAGATLSRVTAALCERLGIVHPVIPMSDDPVRTMVVTADGTLPFQDYFVRHACAPVVQAFAFDGAAIASPAPALAKALASPDLSAIVLCPSNPYVSIAPILAIPAVAAALEAHRVPLVAVSPIIGGDAVKGPLAKMMRELGVVPSAVAVSAHYGSLLDGLIIDRADARLAGPIEAAGTAVHLAPILMRNADDEARLAEEVLSFATTLQGRHA
jgi:LPPG:FO 2-phospho-L-lactate transferase